MSKIAAEHLSRQAYVYIRQSTFDQVQNNRESKLRQYGLADHARRLGWSDVTVIDDDLGRSGSGIHRPGFERLLAVLCGGEVGAVFCIEASRLARNGRDWHTLLRVVRCLPVRAGLSVHDGTQWAGVGQTPREETAGCTEAVERATNLWRFEYPHSGLMR
jgi:Resolvase, N terminal domain